MNGAMNSSMEDTESTLPDSLKPKELVVDDDDDDKKCDEKILKTEMNNAPEKQNINVVENNINSNKPIVEFLSSSEVTLVKAEPENDYKVLLISNDNTENETGSNYVIKPGKDSLNKYEHENSELQGAQEVIMPKLEVICGDCDDYSVEQISRNETCLKIKEEDLSQEEHEDITQNERILSVPSPVEQEIKSENHICVKEEHKKSSFSNIRYEDFENYDQVDKCDTVPDHGSVEQNSWNETCLKIKEEDLSQEEHEDITQNERILSVPSPIVQEIKSENDIYVKEEHKKSSFFNIRYEDFENYDQVDKCDTVPDHGSVEQISWNETCLKIKEEDLSQEEHEDITQNERILSVSSPVVQEIKSENDIYVKEEHKKSSFFNTRYEDFENYDQVDKCDTVPDHGSVEQISWNETCLKIKEEDLSQEEHRDNNTQNERILSVPCPVAQEIKTENDIYVKEEHKKSSFFNIRYEDFENYDQVDKCDTVPDHGSVEQISWNETCLKIKEEDLSQEVHEDITQNERILSVPSPVVQEINSENDIYVKEEHKKSSFFNIRYEDFENYDQVDKCDTVPDHGSVEQISWNETCLKIKEEDLSQEEHEDITQNERILSVPSPVVQEINSENDIYVKEEHKKSSFFNIRYEDFENYDQVDKCDTISDVEVVTVDNLWNKHKPIVVKGTKKLLDVAARQSTTPICNKTSLTAQKSSDKLQPTANQHILPSLTDDMFVVEAPSFIVPYVYEKPSIKPFREYVDVLGKELKEQELKELELKEQTFNDENVVKKEYFNDYEQSKNKYIIEAHQEMQYDSKVEHIKQEPEEEERDGQEWCRNDNDDAPLDGKSCSDVNENLIREEDEDKKLINVSEFTIPKIDTGKPDKYFDHPLGTFFIDIGQNLVQEFVQNDLLKEENRKLNREKKSGHNTQATESSIISLTKNLELCKKNNAPYQFKQRKCSVCGFKTNSQLVLAHHIETPHMRNNVYRCNYCTFAIKSPHEILQHLDLEHNIKGKLERAFAYHQCVNCPFEHNSKGKLARHQISCAKKFKPELNLAPPLDWEPPAKIPKITKSRKTLMGPYPSAFHRSVTNSPIRAVRVPGSAKTTVQQNSLHVKRSSPVPTTSRVTPVHGAPMIRSGVVRNYTSLLLPVNSSATSDCKNVGTIKSLAHHPSISVTPLPRQSSHNQPQQSHQGENSYVVCEICDGYIKDLEQLRNHMQWIHEAIIHPKMIYNRPPLNCQKCHCRFFTDQGLERHLLGSHGLVTNSMQQAANEKRDAGRCPVCGKVYQWKLLDHVSRDHNLTLKPAHLSYECTVCAATFDIYRQFESHVYSSHSIVAKCVLGEDVPKKPNDPLLKQLKMEDDGDDGDDGDEITITLSPHKD